ncbi:MAG: adenylyltransferase/cytidyltransferase family protein [Elusimicrobia bacterium]|nr:adenylyltransferase/cytidyltransferase family protein [Elusimicrobiota bacterium]
MRSLPHRGAHPGGAHHGHPDPLRHRRRVPLPRRAQGALTMSPFPTRKLVSWRSLSALRRAWSRRRKRVVFTNGVFDILHAGHVEFLERARNLGDALVVGINTDASARRLEKGPGRPFNRLKDRARVLGALACVDVIAPFSHDTPETLVRLLRPDILVKGADYRSHEVAGRQHAGKTVLISLKKGYSTTSLAARIRRGAP